MRYALFCAALSLAIVLPNPVQAINSVEIIGQDQVPPNSSVDVRVKLTNDVELRSFAIPLVFRGDSVNGVGANTRFTSIRYGWRDRLPIVSGPLSDIVINNMYDPILSDSGTCYTPIPQVGGFGNNPALIYPDTSLRSFSEMPVAGLLARYKIFSPTLSAGADAVGSILIAFELNEQDGCFIIDTTCVNPAHHIVFIDVNNELVPLEFIMGRVCVGIEECANLGLEAPEVIDPFRETGSNVIEFSWGAVTGAASYTIELDSADETFSDPFYRNTTTDLSYVVVLDAGALSDILPFYWRVRANPVSPSLKQNEETTEVPSCPGPWTDPLLYPMCDCPQQGDVAPRFTGDSKINLLDVVSLIDEVFFGGPPPTDDHSCPLSRSDIAPLDTCGDGVSDVLDILVMIDYAFRGGDPFCDPCAL